MCGIIGYIGKSQAVPILLDGLRRLEYRGYDSAGVAIYDAGNIELRKRVGRIANLAELIKQSPPARHLEGISHTRWATHGGVTDDNAHPHSDQSGKLFLCHNGVIENYNVLKDQLVKEGHTFKSQTDTEVLAHLIGKHYDAAGGEPTKGRLVEGPHCAWRSSRSSAPTASVMMHKDLPDILVGARRGSPLVLGVGKGEKLLCQRCLGHRRLHARRGLSQGLRHRRARARSIRDHEPARRFERI